MDPFVATLTGVLGLVLGSFANVVIYRVPLGRSVVRPPSACPRCGRPVKPWENVPVASWLALRGRCAGCRAKIGLRYPLVELSMGVLFALAGLFYGVSFVTVLLCTAAWYAVVLAAIDIDVRRLPRVLVWPWTITTAVLITAHAVVNNEPGLALRTVIGALALGVFYAAAFFAYPKGLGWGDVTVAPVVGATVAFFGWPELIVGAFAAFVWGLVGAIGPMIKARSVRGVAIPFGPWIFLGALTGIACGAQLAQGYLDLVLST